MLSVGASENKTFFCPKNTNYLEEKSSKSYHSLGEFDPPKNSHQIVPLEIFRFQSCLCSPEKNTTRASIKMTQLIGSLREFNLVGDEFAAIKLESLINKDKGLFNDSHRDKLHQSLKSLAKKTDLLRIQLRIKQDKLGVFRQKLEELRIQMTGYESQKNCIENANLDYNKKVLSLLIQSEKKAAEIQNLRNKYLEYSYETNLLLETLNQKNYLEIDYNNNTMNSSPLILDPSIRFNESEEKLIQNQKISTHNQEPEDNYKSAINTNSDDIIYTNEDNLLALTDSVTELTGEIEEMLYKRLPGESLELRSQVEGEDQKNEALETQTKGGQEKDDECRFSQDKNLDLMSKLDLQNKILSEEINKFIEELQAKIMEININELKISAQRYRFKKKLMAVGLGRKVQFEQPEVIRYQNNGECSRKKQDKGVITKNPSKDDSKSQKTPTPEKKSSIRNNSKTTNRYFKHIFLPLLALLATIAITSFFWVIAISNKASIDPKPVFHYPISSYR